VANYHSQKALVLCDKPQQSQSHQVVPSYYDFLPNLFVQLATFFLLQVFLNSQAEMGYQFALSQKQYYQSFSVHLLALSIIAFELNWFLQYFDFVDYDMQQSVLESYLC